MEIWRDIRTFRFWRRFSTHVLAAIGSIVLLLELAGFVLPDEVSLKGAPLTIGIAIASIIYGLVSSWPRPIEQTYNSPNTKIRIIKGDLLDQDVNIVVGTCDTFDTQPPTIIERSSLQGQMLDRLFGGDIARLDSELDSGLAGKQSVGVIQKAGKQNKYGIGAVSVLRHGARRVFMLAYCEMDTNNNASSSADCIWRSLLALWTEVSRLANGATLAVPVIGGGLSRVSGVLPAQDSIRFIALSFMLASRSAPVCNELRIVVQPRDYERLDRLELQSFLSSLRAS